MCLTNDFDWKICNCDCHTHQGVYHCVPCCACEHHYKVREDCPVCDPKDPINDLAWWDAISQSNDT